MSAAAGLVCDFAINGRFFGQPVTGVQRYAREVVRALDGLLAGRGRRATLVVPRASPPLPSLPAMDVRRTGAVSGHAWEQLVLPARWHGPLVNLCNTAPLVRSAQVVCIHDANVFQMPESYGWRFRALYRAMQPLLARRAARVATVSHDAARQLAAHLPVAESRVEILPNGHEHALRWRAEAATVFADRPQARPFVLLLGSRARHKNAALIFGLAGFLNGLGVDLLVAGGASAIFAAEDARPGPNVRLLGKVSDDDLALLFSRALCLAFPSFTEGFGLPVVEAMALGCPVVSSDRASLLEVCGDAALLASPIDPEAWARHFTALATSPGLREDLRGRGRRHVARFSWAATAQRYLELGEALS